MIYWDTSCVLKLYVKEPDSDVWEGFAAKSSDVFISSALLETEMASALHRRSKRNELCNDGLDVLLEKFRRDVAQETFTLVPIGKDVLSVSCEVIACCINSPSSVMLRAMDALHLATAKITKCRRIATADERLKRAASIMGIESV